MTDNKQTLARVNLCSGTSLQSRTTEFRAGSRWALPCIWFIIFSHGFFSQQSAILTMVIQSVHPFLCTFVCHTVTLLMTLSVLNHPQIVPIFDFVFSYLWNGGS